jgi:hypothetical protein
MSVCRRAARLRDKDWCNLGWSGPGESLFERRQREVWSAIVCFYLGLSLYDVILTSPLSLGHARQPLSYSGFIASWSPRLSRSSFGSFQPQWDNGPAPHHEIPMMIHQLLPTISLMYQRSRLVARSSPPDGWHVSGTVLTGQGYNCNNGYVGG